MSSTAEEKQADPESTPETADSELADDKQCTHACMEISTTTATTATRGEWASRARGGPGQPTPDHPIHPGAHLEETWSYPKLDQGPLTCW